MNDPAVEAAQRALDALMPGIAGSHKRVAVDAAREALKQVRELHYKCLNGGGDWVCAECSWVDVVSVYWPCGTAELAYTSEELE